MELNLNFMQFLAQESSGKVSRKLKRCKQICFDGLFKAKPHLEGIVYIVFALIN